MNHSNGVPLRILTFTSLFPNAVQPQFGVFIETRLRQLLATGRVSARAVAPVPWFPFRAAAFGRYGSLGAVPKTEERNGITVHHPRYVVIPKVGMNLAPMLMVAGVRKIVEDLARTGAGFDLIDAHYFYPDGVAAVMLGRLLKKPVVVTARGSDLNLIARYAIPRQLIRWAADNAAQVVTVSEALKEAAASIAGLAPERIRVLRNGVDLSLFRPIDREQVRATLGLNGFVLISVGNLVPLNGHDLVIRSLAAIPDATLLLVGGGPEEQRLRQLCDSLQLGDRVRFVGPVPHRELHTLYGAADVLVLASSREGWPNVLLESMACGTPAVAANVGGVPEIVTAHAAGRLLAERSADGIVETITALRLHMPRREDTRRFAEGFGWEEVTQGQIDVFERVLSRQPQIARR